MLKNYLKIALRNLRRHKSYAFINVFGLAIGLACCLLIVLFIRDEWSYDQFHEKGDRIVRMGVDFVVEGETRKNVSTQGLLAPALEADLPEVEKAVRIIGGGSVLRVGSQQFQEDGIAYADSAFFEVFSFPLLRGNPQTVLAEPNALVLSETLAHKYFGEENPIGQTIYDRDRPLTVTGVMADVPQQSHLQFDGVVSLSTASDPGWWYNNWFSVNFRTYALLQEGTSVQALRAKLPDLIERRAGEEMRSMNQQIVLHAEPLTDVYLRSDRSEPFERGNLASLYIFGTVAIFVLLIACFNFTNLATARSVDRAKEVGVRKMLGAARVQLGLQFLAEAFLLSVLALLLALALVESALPMFETLTEKNLSLADLGPWLFGLIGLVIGVSLLAGAYPAFALSSFRPAQVLKGRYATGQRGGRLRQSLVVLQFSISIALIVGTAVVYSQLDYMQNRNLGFDLGSDETGQLLALNFGGEDALQTQLDAVKQRFLNHPSVTGVASSITVPASGHPAAGGEIERLQGGMRDFTVEAYLVDTNFVDVYQMEMVMGQKPGSETVSDSLVAYVLNETAVREAGYPDPAAVLGKRARFWGAEGEVVGVIKDFHTSGLQQPVQPLALVATDLYQSVLTLRVQTTNLQQTLADLETIWSEVAPERPFAYRFLDDAFGAEYEAEQRFGKVFGVLASLAILIACLGLFGLAAFTTAQRTKEVGIRKVLGASIGGLVALLSKEFVKLVAIAFVIAAPISYLAMNRWLADFAYHINLGVSLFALAGVLALTIALLTVSYQAIKAALADPVKSLRYE